MRWKVLAGVGVVSALLALVDCSSDDPFDGTVTAPAEQGEGVEDRWVVTIDADLGANPVSGQDVQVAFDAGDLTCDDDRALDPADLAIGDRVTVEPVSGGGVETMDPPIIGATSVVVECGAA
ncbi:MAG: hypothetical protein S0880_06490 [Actinomycetota bacterium]|nr:hypothetical protein [Actinomycetota bacterium]